MERPERDHPPKDDSDYWRAYRALPIADFFQSWKDNYRCLDWVTVPDNPDDGAMLSYTTRTDVSGRRLLLDRLNDEAYFLAGGSSDLSCSWLARFIPTGAMQEGIDRMG
jgi:hypothetical protein